MDEDLQVAEEVFDIVHVTTVHRALDSRIFYREARSAQRAGWRVAVIGPNEGGSVTVGGVQIIQIPKPQSRLVRRLLSPLRAFRQAVRLRPQVIHFHDPEFIPAGLLLKAFGYRVVWDIHEYYSFIAAEGSGWKAIRWLKKKVIGALVETGPCLVFDRVVFPTHALREAVWAGKNAVVCVNLLPSDEFPSWAADSEKIYDLIFVGTMSPFRAGPFMKMVALLRAQRPDFKAALLGVSEQTRLWMLSAAPSPDVIEALTFLPRVPHHEVAMIVRQARVGFNFHPMQRRFQVALPMKVYEYMACALPVVCSWFPELGRQLSDEEIIFVHGDNMADYAAAVETLLSDCEKLENVGSAGNNAVRSRLNWEKTEAPKLIAMYAELMERS